MNGLRVGYSQFILQAQKALEKEQSVFAKTRNDKDIEDAKVGIHYHRWFFYTPETQARKEQDAKTVASQKDIQDRETKLQIALVRKMEEDLKTEKMHWNEANQNVLEEKDAQINRLQGELLQVTQKLAKVLLPCACVVYLTPLYNKSEDYVKTLTLQLAKNEKQQDETNQKVCSIAMPLCAVNSDQLFSKDDIARVLKDENEKLLEEKITLVVQVSFLQLAVVNFTAGREEREEMGRGKERYAQTGTKIHHRCAETDTNHVGIRKTSRL